MGLLGFGLRCANYYFFKIKIGLNELKLKPVSVNTRYTKNQNWISEQKPVLVNTRGLKNRFQHD